MDITLFEKINKEKLEEVLKCENIPFETTDDKKWIDIFRKQIKKYYKSRTYEHGKKITYTQKNNFGRYTTSCGLQGFQKDVRKYISGEFVRDFDFKNCHPVILEQLFKKHNLYSGDFLTEYNKNKDEVMKKNGIRSKTVLIEMINNEITPMKSIFKELHFNIYNLLVPKLIKENKSLFDRIKKDRKKKFNFNGGFISHYLQNIENQMLMVFYNYLNEKGIRIHSLMFDGLTIDKDANFDIKEVEEKILQETGFQIDIVEKSTKTDWKPIINEEIDLYKEVYNTDNENFDIELNRKLYEDCIIKDDSGAIVSYDNEAIDNLIEYINKFVCKVNYPHGYGIRFNTKDHFEMRSSEKVKDRIRFGFDDNNVILNWKNSKKALTFNKFVFQVDEKKIKQNEYNLYRRPKFIECDYDTLKERVPLFFDFLKRIISSDDEDVYNYLNHYIAKMVQVGNTKQCIVLKGGKGIGKTAFTTILKLIIEEIENEYSKNVNDINDMMNRFNGMDFKCILTTIEEVVNKAGEYHSIQSKLKDLITADYIKLEMKGVDAFMIPSHNNLILITNEENPVRITDDNRRYLVLRVSSAEKNNSNYFINLLNQVKENIEYIRGYYYKYEYVDNLNRIRPVTEEEEDLLRLNMPSEVEFVKYHINDCFEEGEDEVELNTIFSYYESFCGRERKKVQKKEYFSKMLKNNGYITTRKWSNGEKKRYIKRCGPAE